MDYKNIKVLIVDDVQDNLITLSALIRETFSSAKIFSALNGNDAIEIAKKEDPDMILLDILMPGMDGYKVCKLLKKEPLTRDIPVVFVTALRNDPENKVKALEVGADAFISKPIDEIELVAQIRAMAKIKKAATDRKNENERLQQLVDEKTKELQQQNETTKFLFDNLKIEFEKRVQSENEMKVKELENQFLYQTTSELMHLTSIKEVYEYTAHKLYHLLDQNAIICVAGFNLDINKWKLIHVEGISDTYTQISNLFGIDVMNLEGEIKSQYYHNIISGDLTEIELHLPALFNNKITESVGKALVKLVNIDKIFCISFQQEDQIYGNITIITNKKTRPINKNLVTSFIQQVTSFIRKQTIEDALKISEKKYKTLFDNMIDGFALHEMIFDDNGNPIDYKFLDVNEAYEIMTGVKASNLIGKTALELFPNLDQSWIEKYGKVSDSGEPINFEYYAPSLDKFFKVSAFKPANNQFAYLCTDISESKKTDEKIRKNEVRLQGMVRILQHQTESVQEFLDYALEEAIKLTESKIGYLYYYDEKKREFELNTWSKDVMKECGVLNPQTVYELDKTGIWGEVVRQRKEIIVNDFQLSHPLKKGYPEGHTPLSRFLSIPIFSGNSIVAVVGFANKETDYTNDDLLQIQLLMDGVWREVERKKAEKTLLKNEETYETFFNANEDFIFLKDENCKYLIVNDAIANFFNTTKENMIGKSDDELATNELIQPCRSSDLKVIETNTTIKLEERMGAGFFETRKFPVKLNDDKIGVGGIIRDISDSKKAEERERFIAGITAAVSDAIIATDLNFKITYINQRAEELYGYTLDEVLGQPTRIVYAIDDIQDFEKKVRGIITHGGKYVGEFLQKRKDGSTFMAEMKAQPMLDEEGKIVTYIGIQRDITQRKQYELQLLEQEKQFRNLANSGLALIWTSDVNKLCNYFNEPWLKFTGRTLEQELGNGWLEGVHPDDMAQCMEIYCTAFDKRVPFDMEYRMKHHNGEYKWIRDLGSPIYSSTGAFVGYIGHCFDMTERKKNELVQQIQMKIAQSIQEVTDITSLLEIIHVELSKIFDTENFFVALYNEERDTMINLINRDELDYLNEWPAEDSLSGYVAKTGKSVFMKKDEILKLSEKNGMKPIGTIAEVWLGVPINIPNKSRGAMVIQDYKDPDIFTPSDLILLEMIAHETEIFIEKQQIMEELVKAKEKAEESDRLKSAFLANMSHEIRTPMNGILGFSSLLKEPGLTGDQQMEYINIIEKSGARMLNIINDIIDISKIEAGLMKVDVTSTNVNEQTEFVYNFFKPEVDAKGMTLTLSKALPFQKSFIETDREKLFAILINLVKNAIKYSISGYINFGYVVKNGMLEFFVEDTGIGIPKERRAAIFERFIQADITDVMARQGAGLGLAITKAYVEMLGGSIWVESEVGIGSKFFFTLPYNFNQNDIVFEHENPYSSAKVSPDQSVKLNILIAEDDQISAMVLTKALKDYTNTLFQVQTGPKVLDILSQHPEIDLILLDVNLPEMTGYEVAARIRQTNKEIKIFAQTAYSISSERHIAIEAGCNEFLSKPIKRSDLITLIQKYFN